MRLSLLREKPPPTRAESGLGGNLLREYHYWATHLRAFDLLLNHVGKTFDRLLSPNQGQFALIKVKSLPMPRGGGGGGGLT